MDGWITIGTKLDTKQLESDLKKEESRLKQYQKEAEKLTTQKTKIEVDLQEYEKAKVAIQQSTNEILRTAQTQEQVEFVLAGENTELQQLNEKYSKQFTQIEDINKKIQENAYNQKLVTNEIDRMNNKLIQTRGFDSIKEGIKNVGKSVENVTKKIGRWAIAIFGVRSAYMAVRNAINVIANDDEQLKADIDYMKRAMVYTLEPLVRKIIELAKQLMFYVGYIVKAWTGKNIFASANKNLKKATGSAKQLNKELNKTIASFDEMNVVQDTSSSDVSGSSGIVTPSFDLESGNIEPPGWLKWIADNKDLILSVLGGIIGALTAIKLGFGAIQAIGIGITIMGIVYAIQALIDYLNNPSFKNFGKIIQGIGVAIIGVGIAVGSLPVVIAGAITIIWGTIVKYWDKIQAFLQGGIDWLKGKSDWIHKVFGDNIGNMYDNFVNTLQSILDWAGRIMNGIKKNFDELISFVKNVFAGNWKGAWQNVKNIFTNIWNGMKNTAKTVLNGILNTAKNIGSGVGKIVSNAFKSVINTVLDYIEGKLNKPIDAINALNDVINKVPGIHLGKISRFKLPRLAKGAIASYPGRGIPTTGGGAKWAEAGQEAYLPLTDSQFLSRLGQSIGEHVVINLTNVNQMNGRVISREMKKINNESDFAFNR